jgi:hypothetical protein
LTDFRNVLGAEITAEALLKKLTHPNASLFDILRKNEVLYGILLGYGKDNAIFFKRKLELSRFVDPMYHGLSVHEDPYISYSLIFPRPSYPFSSIEEEYHHLQRQGRFFAWDYRLSFIEPPNFVSVNNHETQYLKQKYQQLHRKLMRVYSKGDFLPVTLTQLCKEED